MGSAAASAAARRLTVALGGAERTRVIIVLAAILGLSGADAATVGASAQRAPAGPPHHRTPTSACSSRSAPLVGAFASLPFGVLADRVTTNPGARARRSSPGAPRCSGAPPPRTSRSCSWTRLFLGAVTASAGPMVASLVGDWFGSWERGRIYGVILAGEYVGAGIGFAVTGDVAALSWRAAFVILALPAFVLACVVVAAARAGARRQGRARLRQGGRLRPRLLAQAQDGNQTTDAQRLARERGLVPDPELVVDPGTARRMNLWRATRYVLRVRTNIILDRRERVRLLLPRRPADVRRWSSRRSSTGSTRRSRARSCSWSASARWPASSPAAALGDCAPEARAS